MGTQEQHQQCSPKTDLPGVNLVGVPSTILSELCAVKTGTLYLYADQILPITYEDKWTGQLRRCLHVARQMVRKWRGANGA